MLTLFKVTWGERAFLFSFSLLSPLLLPSFSLSLSLSLPLEDGSMHVDYGLHVQRVQTTDRAEGSFQKREEEGKEREEGRGTCVCM